MIRLGLRLSLARHSVARLAVTAAGVALGVGLLLATLSGINALHAQDRRTAWLGTTAHNQRPSVDERTTDPLWGRLTMDQFGSKEIDRVDVAATGPRSPVPPGIPRLPRPGEYYASPALSRLLRSTPAAELGDRYPGKEIGTIGDAALASPDSLTIIIGRSVGELAGTPGAAPVRSIETSPHGSSPFNHHPGRIELILAVVAGALLFPVMIFITTTTRLAAARREQRLAAMRLVGATPGQVSLICTVEAVVAAVAGVAGGFALFSVARPAMAKVPFTGLPFFARDLTVSAIDVVLIAVGIPLVAAVAATLTLRRVAISPLGVARHAATEMPSAWRTVPLVLGLVELGYFAIVGPPATTGRQIDAYGLGFVLVMVGLLVAGPWLTMAGARLVSTRAKRPAALIAGRRLADNPRAAFRSVSGLIIALFITTTALGVISTVVGYHDVSTGGSAGRRLMADDFIGQPLASLPPRLVSRLTTTPGVRGVVVVHADLGPPDGGVVACTDLAHIPTLGHCELGADVAVMPLVLAGRFGGGASTLGVEKTRGAAATPLTSVSSLPIRSVYVDTDGSTSAIEGVRTLLEAALPADRDTVTPPSTISEISPDAHQQLAGYERLADVAIVASLPIAACSLAVSVAAGLTDRKRPFSLLRLTGTPLSVLRRVVALEAAVPLILVSALSGGAGLIAADLFLHAQLQEALRPPGGAYYAAVAGAMLAALGIIAATLPLLERMTGPEVARNE